MGRHPFGVRTTGPQPDSVSDLETIRHAPFNAETPEHALRHGETPSENVYVRSNFDVPQLGLSHRIETSGHVDSPFAVSAHELATLPQQTISVTMECAGNSRLTMIPLPAGEPWKHGAVSTMTWTGVPLRALLERAGVRAGATDVLFAGADSGPRDDATGAVRFERSLPFQDAMYPGTLLALAMNGAPLTAAHGAPVRLVVPGWFGMANVKWLSRIEVSTVAFTGYFQRQRYVYDEAMGITPVTRMRVKSMITSPTDGARCTQSVMAEGWAWSGEGAITHVEVAVDGGDRWISAELGIPASEYAWTPWRCALTLPRGMRCALRSRATDAAGNVQPAQIAWNRLGYGNNAVRAIVVNTTG